MSKERIPVVVLGATGAVGQRFLSLLDGHPWFEVTGLGASARSAGKAYGEAVNWKVSSNIPPKYRQMVVYECEPENFNGKIAFSGLDSSVAGEVEERFARAGYAVISNSRNHRMDPDVPLLIPEVNPDHLALLSGQKNRFGNGFIVTNPNCTTVGLTMVLKPLHEKFGVTDVVVTTMQALSGAGYPGVSSLDALDNVYPFIPGEEEKVETEPLKLLGSVTPGSVEMAQMNISATCNRVAVRDGHLETATIGFVKKPMVREVIKALMDFRAEPQELNLPSAPEFPIVVRAEEDRPQPVLDRDTGGGMSVVVGRIRESKVLDISLSLLVHNTIRGAAGAAILNAELLVKKGYLDG